MKKVFLGFDTSNYRTSAAAVTAEGEILFNARKLLPVAPGKRGLRQNEAVFLHIRQMREILPKLREALRGVKVTAVTASSRPRSREDSYMPVFQVGDTIACSIAAAMDVPSFLTDHQQGHIAAAAHGTVLERAERFLALHLSGGTTELLFQERSSLTELGGTLDLQAGQLVDRAGVAMGMRFPSGPELEILARKGCAEGRLGCSMAEGDLKCHFSGAETRILQWIADDTMPREDIAREIYDLLARTTARMLKAGQARTGVSDVLIAGGIAASGLFREELIRRCTGRGQPLRLVFGDPEMCGDNAVGVALIGARKYLDGGAL